MWMCAHIYGACPRVGFLLPVTQNTSIGSQKQHTREIKRETQIQTDRQSEKERERARERERYKGECWRLPINSLVVVH